VAVHLRDATPADLGVVAGLIRALAEYEHLEDEVLWSEEELATTLFGPDAVPRVVLAEPDDAPGVVAGLAIWFPTYSTFRGRPGIWLEDLFVRPEHRGKGVGRALLDHLFERAGDGRVEWAVLDWNAPSLAFYQSLGAQPVDGWTVYRWLRQAENSQARSEPEPEQ
jgi:GNAT superfamily N-acetyltransferase